MSLKSSLGRLEHWWSMTLNSLEYGVYYASSDYIGVWRRFGIDLVDVVVAGTVSLAFSAVLILLLSNGDQLAFGLLVVWSCVWFGYFVLLKRSRLRTVGYVLAGARIVNLYGDTPSVASLFIRVLFAALGPLNLLFDLFWIPSDRAGRHSEISLLTPTSSAGTLRLLAKAASRTGNTRSSVQATSFRKSNVLSL